jgi:hypothetical protein
LLLPLQRGSFLRKTQKDKGQGKGEEKKKEEEEEKGRYGRQVQQHSEACHAETCSRRKKSNSVVV